MTGDPQVRELRPCIDQSTVAAERGNAAMFKFSGATNFGLRRDAFVGTFRRRDSGLIRPLVRDRRLKPPERHEEFVHAADCVGIGRAIAATVVEEPVDFALVAD